MRYLYVLLLSATAATAADFTTGQAAYAVIGQPTFGAGLPGASQTLVGAVSGLAYANGTLFVCDSNRVGSTPVNNRVLIYKNLPNVVLDPTQEGFQDARCPVCTAAATT